MEKLTKEQIGAKASELSKKFDCEVTPISTTDRDGNQITAYFKEPSYDVQIAAAEWISGEQKEIGKAGEAIIKDCLIAEESSPLVTSDERKHARIKAFFTLACTNMLKPYIDEVKKK